LGDRLRSDGAVEEADLRLLDGFRRSFREGYDFVVVSLREDLGLKPTGRPAKSTASIREKLRRETIRLSQMQDIAGCRVVVESMQEQESVLKAMQTRFREVALVDRRGNPSYGYRAVHVIVRHEGKVIEIQVRTLLQHGWAEFSEKLADVLDPAIKYGGGTRLVRKVLDESSSLVAQVEDMEVFVDEAKRDSKRARSRLASLMRRARTQDDKKIRALLPRAIESRDKLVRSTRRVVAKSETVKARLRRLFDDVISKLSA
jgi:putative GTP pyrophosphokinase